MKKHFSHFFALAALLTAGAAFTACSNGDDIVSEQPAAPGEQVYTLTINANHGASTRALALDGTKLVASWADDDVLTVYNKTKGAALTGSLTAFDADGSKASFTGTLTGTIEADDVLILSYHQPAGFSTYAAQTGTLASAAACDYATAEVTVDAVNSGNITIKETAASFATQTTALKLTLTDGTNKINATSLKVEATMSVPSLGSMTVELATFNLSSNPYSANGDGVLYLVLPNKAAAAEYVANRMNKTYSLSLSAAQVETNFLPTATITFTATLGDDNYVTTKTGYTFEAAKYYATTLTMVMPFAVKHAGETTFEAVTGNYEAQNGDVLKGTLGGNYKISIAADATVTLAGVTINGVNSNSYQWAGITCLGDATIVLAEGSKNVVKGFYWYNPGLQAGPVGTTLTIKGTGSLEAIGDRYSAAIGSDYASKCGDISIEGGTIIARDNSGEGCAGIGSGMFGGCGDITISGGNITATGSNRNAGIGCGKGGSCGDIKITGGTIKATGGEEAAGIGSGFGGDELLTSACGNISITGGTIIATGGEWAPGIGSGWSDYSECGSITVASTVTSITAIKGEFATGYSYIGKSDKGTCGTVTIDGVRNATPSSTFTNLNSTVKTTTNTNDTWELTH